MTLSLRRRPAPYDPIREAERAAADAELARQRAAAVAADVDRARALAQLHRETANADRAAERDRRAAQEEDARQRRAAELETARLERQHRAARRQDRRERVRRIGVRLRPVAPLLAVNGLALVGQVGYGLDHLSPGAAWPVRLAVAVLFAGALESIALYVGWHSHVALLVGASASAARLRVASYVVAGVVAGINYSHFADGTSPTAPALAYGLVSLLSPWLWGLHSRRELHLALERAGVVDHTGARFSAERWRAFPWRTRGARRWSIDHGITDPREAWTGYAAERAARPPRRPFRIRIRRPRPTPLTSSPTSTGVDTPGDAEPPVVPWPDWAAPVEPDAPPVDVPAPAPAPADEQPAPAAGGRPGTLPEFRGPEVPESAPVAVSQAESIRTALTATGGDVPAALVLLTDQGLTVDSRYANRVARVMSARVDTKSDRGTRTRSGVPAGTRRTKSERGRQ